MVQENTTFLLASGRYNNNFEDDYIYMKHIKTVAIFAVYGGMWDVIVTDWGLV